MASQWTVVAPHLVGFGKIWCLTVFNGELFGGDGTGSSILKWNGTGWDVVGGLGMSFGDILYSIVECNGILYGLSSQIPTHVMEWDPIALDWELPAVCSIGYTVPANVSIWCSSMVQLNNQLYIQAIGNAYGHDLYVWDGLNIHPLTQYYGFSVVATGLLTINFDNLYTTNHLVVYNGLIYTGTSSSSPIVNGGGYLLEWNGVIGDPWAIVAPRIDNQTSITSLAVFGGDLYAGTGPNGELLKWNGVNAWTQVAPQLNAETNILSLAVFGGELYGTTYPNGNLYKWNGINAWVQVISQFSSQTQLTLAEFAGDLYAGTNGNLLLKMIPLVAGTSRPGGSNIPKALLAQGLI